MTDDFHQDPQLLSPKDALRQINSISSPVELLNYVAGHHERLDSINLATVLYRLARIYSFIQSAQQKASWKAELLDHPNFSLLLRTITIKLVEAHAALQQQGTAPGLNAWCLSNVLWSLARLDVLEASEQVAALARDAATVAAPLVTHYLPECSGQGIGNVLWSYVQIPGAPESVMVVVLDHVISLLEGPQAHVVDSHALANTLWSIAHVRSTHHPVDELPEWQALVTKALLLGAAHFTTLLNLNPLIERASGSQDSTDDYLLYQAMATISWSYSMILGSAAGVEEPIRSLFLLIRSRALIRLQVIARAGAAGRRLPHSVNASFNGQILSNLTKAFDAAQLLTPDFLQAMFDVAAVKLSRPGQEALKGFKAEDVASLLRAAQSGIANPTKLVQAVNRLIAQGRHALGTWSSEDVTEVQTLISQIDLSLMPPPPPPPPPAMQVRSAPSVPASQRASRSSDTMLLCGPTSSPLHVTRHAHAVPASQHLGASADNILQGLGRATGLDNLSGGMLSGGTGLSSLLGSSHNTSRMSDWSGSAGPSGVVSQVARTRSNAAGAMSMASSDSSVAWGYSSSLPASQPDHGFGMLQMDEYGNALFQHGSGLVHPGLPPQYSPMGATSRLQHLAGVDPSLLGGGAVAGGLHGMPAAQPLVQYLQGVPGAALATQAAPGMQQGSAMYSNAPPTIQYLTTGDASAAVTGTRQVLPGTVLINTPPVQNVFGAPGQVQMVTNANVQRLGGGQQLWLVDAAGNLQPVTLVTTTDPSLGASSHQLPRSGV